MNFLHPEFLYLAPLVALPIIIHLLNRIRYRRVRWAAIEFLLTSERRAVRRARLKQILLMALRVLLLAAALGALLQPIFRGSLAGLLGASSSVAVFIDNSASMSARDASGSAFERAKKLAEEGLTCLPAGAKAMCGTFSTQAECPFREPVTDRRAVASVIDSAQQSSGSGDVPAALRLAAEGLGRGGAAGTIWLITDAQASGWKASDTGAWQATRKALKDAGEPRVVVTSIAPDIEGNFSIAEVRMTPAVLVELDAPKLTATVERQGKTGGVTTAGLFLDGKRIDSRVVKADGPGKTEVVFHLPSLKSGVHSGRVELSTDALPGDDSYYFMLKVTSERPVIVVDGAPSSAPFEGAGDFVVLALQPAPGDPGARSPFAPKKITVGQLEGTALGSVAAVVLADVARLDAQAVEKLREYVQNGGLVICFAGPHTDANEWNRAGFAGTTVEGTIEAQESKKIKVNWALPGNPITATVQTEGLERLLITRMTKIKAGSGGQVMLATEAGDPVMVRVQSGKGKVYVFAVSGQCNDSSFPFVPAFMTVLHRTILLHASEVGEPPACDAYTVLHLDLPPGRRNILTPNGKMLPTVPDEKDPGLARFSQTTQAGIYRLVEGDTTPGDVESSPVIAAVNVATEETSLVTIDARAIRGLLPDSNVSFIATNGGVQELGGAGASPQGAASGFPFAMFAVAFIIFEAFLAWSTDRPGSQPTKETAA